MEIITMTDEEKKLAALGKELEAYKRELPKLLAQSKEGKYVLIYKEKVIDTYTSYEDALKEGYKLAGLELFLVKKIQSTEEVHFFTRNITPNATLHTAS
jgi:hypothetical protein